MNVIIKNENSQLIDNILFDDSKTLVGKFTLEDLNNQLSSVNYNYAIIDLTSIRNYYDDTYLFSFLSFFSVAGPTPSNNLRFSLIFLLKLIVFKIYFINHIKSFHIVIYKNNIIIIF